MKIRFLVTGDWHITDQKPERRLDSNYYETMRGKLQQIFQIAKGAQCSYIVQPGDFFNHFRVADYIKTDLITLFAKWKADGINIMAIPGQHDMRYHNDALVNTSIGVLQAAGVVDVFTESSFDLQQQSEHVTFYFAGFGKEIPVPVKRDAFNILVTHRMIIKSKKLWAGQKDYAVAAGILKKHEAYNLVVSGDNHLSFVGKYNKRVLLNCGSLMRSTISQVHHRPVVYIVEVDTTSTSGVTYTPCYLQVQDEVFDYTRYEEEKARDAKMEDFLESLEGAGAVSGLDFVDNVRVYVQQNAGGLSKDVQQYISETMREVADV